MTHIPITDLSSADAWLRTQRSLHPDRENPTPLSHLLRRFAPRLGHERPLIRLAHALAHHFPRNIFCDLDALVHVYCAHRSPEPRDEMVDLLVQIHERFGAHGPIRFSYAHDFLYGFDWSRWVKKSPDERALVGPYGIPFLRTLKARAEELVNLVRSDDNTYPHLAGGNFRNPYAFTREPQAETALHEHLASEDLVPVPAWNPQSPARWDQPFTRLREQRAHSLGLDPNPDAPRTPYSPDG